MKNKFERYFNDYFLVILILIIFGFLILSVFSMIKSAGESVSFYKENCQKVNATHLENHALCYKTIDSEIKYYDLEELGGKLLLRENTKFLGVGGS